MCQPMRMIHISDPHLTNLAGIPANYFSGKRRLGYASWRFRRRHRHLRSTLDKLCALAGTLKPDVIVVTGDLVHLGLPEEIAAAAEWLRSLGGPERVFVVPGNHDVYRADSWAAVETHWRDYLRLNPGRRDEPAHWSGFPTLLCWDGVHIHGLNTGLPTPALSAGGELGAGQCGRLAQNLAAAPVDSLHILAIHHPPVLGAVPRRKALSDLGRFEGVASGAHLVLHGHGHFNRLFRLGEIPVFATGSASKADAALRCFDIGRETRGWHVEMRLHVRDADGFSVTETRAFEFSQPLTGMGNTSPNPLRSTIMRKL